MVLGTSSLVVGVGITLLVSPSFGCWLLYRHRNRGRRFRRRIPRCVAHRLAAGRVARAGRRAVRDLRRVLPRDGSASRGCRLPRRAPRRLDDRARIRRRRDGAGRDRPRRCSAPSPPRIRACLTAITWLLRVRDGVRARYTGARRSLVSTRGGSRRHGGKQRDGESAAVRRAQGRTPASSLRNSARNATTAPTRGAGAGRSPRSLMTAAVASRAARSLGVTAGSAQR